MSVSNAESKIVTLRRELERLNRSLTQEEKSELGYQNSKTRIEKSINKNTSASSLKTKLKSISAYQDRINNSRKKQSEIKMKISKKQTDITKKEAELQKAQGKVFSEMEKKQAAAIADQIKAVKEIAIASKNSNLNQAQKEYDFFISHASEDKEAIAEPLAKALINRGARVWYDKFTLAVGDSLRESIDYGLVHSTFGIVILSEVYFKKFWTGKELNGLFAKQEEGRKVILPLWHNVTKDIVKQKSPILADMLALKTADLTVEEIADSFYEFISSKTEVDQ